MGRLLAVVVVLFLQSSPSEAALMGDGEGYPTPGDTVPSVLDEPRIAYLWPMALAMFPAAASCADLEIGEGGLYDDTDSGEAFPSICEIRLREGWLTWNRSYLLAVLSHEAGHISGLSHSADPTSPMAHNFEISAFPAAMALRKIELQIEDAKVRSDYAEEQIAYEKRQLVHARSSNRRQALRRAMRRWSAVVEVKTAAIPVLTEQLGP